MPPLTTIKVPVELRDRLGAEARTQGKTLAQFLERLLREYETDRRYEELAEAIRQNPPDEEYMAGVRWWGLMEPELPDDDWSDEPSYPED